MARPLRLEVAGGVYHVTARGNERRPIFLDRSDRVRYLEILAQTCGRFRWDCLAYCLMTNHYHLLVRTREPNLARGMRQLNGVYAQGFNRRYRRVGHLFQGRYRAVLIEAESQLQTVVAYIVRNPVRAGLCQTPDEWPWSSHRATLGAHPPGVLALEELLEHFGGDGEQARRRYRELVEGDMPSEGVHGNGAIAGSTDFVLRHLRTVEPSREVPAAQRRLPSPPLDELLAASDGEEIARACEAGYTMSAIARHLGVHPSTVSRRLSRQLGRRPHHAQSKT